MIKSVTSKSDVTQSISKIKLKQAKICTNDIKMFVNKYEKEANKILGYFRGLPPEIYLLKLIVEKQNKLKSENQHISDNDKAILECMIEMNIECRKDRPNLRLRDLIIDRLIVYFDLDHDVKSKYVSFKDLF